jgi:hypothetical protein
MKRGVTREEFLKKAKRQRIIVHKNNVKKAKPLAKICGSITTSYPTRTEELLRR